MHIYFQPNMVGGNRVTVKTGRKDKDHLRSTGGHEKQQGAAT